MKRRLEVLDGLRGFAILLVFLNHIDSRHFADAVPVFFKPFIHFLFTSGNLGVTFFFILSGFLMGYLYANPSPREFIERRYARIFPPFIVMSFCMWVFRLYPATPLLLRIPIMLVSALFVRNIWKYIVERYHKGSLFITLFLALQLVVACWYGLLIMRRPPIWFDSLPFMLKEGTIFAVNATLTLPLGNYIPLLDGVYWSLVPEMIFYLLYPYLFSPTVHALEKKSNLFKGLFLLSLFPFFFGMSLLFHHSQGLSMLFIEYFIYFCGGIAIAMHLRKKEIDKGVARKKSFISPVLFLLILFLSYALLSISSDRFTILIRLLLVIPFGYLVYSLLEHDSSLKRFFENKRLLFLGTISYSMYIGHTAIVDGMHLIFRPTNMIENILFLVLTTVVFLLVSFMLHEIIEKPYFEYKPAKKIPSTEQVNPRNAYLMLFLTIGLLFFSTYTSQYNFFSQQRKYKDIIPATVRISPIPYTFSFVAQEDNMGVILVHLTNTVGEENQDLKRNSDPNKHQRFQMRMKEQGSSEWISTQDTAPAEIGNSSSYPFGFPLIAHSKGKAYVVEMKIIDRDYQSTVILNKDEYPLTSIHQIPKQLFLKKPALFLSHLLGKVQVVFAQPESVLTALCVSPFFILLIALI